MEEVLSTNMVDGKEHSEKKSEYFSFAQKAKCEQDVIKDLSKLKVKFADATHISCAYRFKKAATPFEQGYEDDCEIGVGHAILSAIQDKGMSEICVYLVRYYGGQHLGNR